jgi:hypothetical protein
LLEINTYHYHLSEIWYVDCSRLSSGSSGFYVNWTI